MIDLSGLAQPLLDLLSSFGSGVLGTDGASDGLRSTSLNLDQIYELGRTGINNVNTAWDGMAVDAATAKALRVQNSSATLSDTGNEMATVLDQAAAYVETGQKDLDTIVNSFLTDVSALSPTLATPVGLAAVVSSAIEHIGQGLGVVSRVQDELGTQTAAIQELTPAPSSTSLANTTSGVSTLASSASSLLSTASGTGGTLLSAVSSGLSSALSNSSSSSKSTTTGTTNNGSKTSTGSSSGSSTGSDGTGVKITLPDGSTVEAPNEEAATAVRSAISAVGTPYVWGGNSPGSGIDCSGLTQYAYREAGVELPRLAQEQHIGHPQVSPGDLKPGDLAVWDGHVAMVVGNGQLVEAGDPVSISSIRTENSGMEFYGFYRPTA
ncbi:NlpC/P60 family protein [Nocardia asteroides NBRC 15531]|uniref:NlpC/P60 family protein n=1 Tax=Nocardia asteroides NBRC 15531 TaxID=1110697 RepID=U5ECA0_NOCAS|nr:C40 family peptidase [Nocardia asteroides]TLF65653.1 NlpC/P60 family protein [Nocardia asteroides NBRC 15531]UGT47578.1 C40 family peptidase [Nocardia asteroides]SFM49099.1 Cell wall-associated hydrolase, NlpC family [Nocardia asteroides]VEG33511.1 Probable endopeptidase p60 precursor [Nocardia asteroides]GAD87752.1 NlpC/P60 family protein [Nocardia asteroides NBRC 15531]